LGSEGSTTFGLVPAPQERDHSPRQRRSATRPPAHRGAASGATAPRDFTDALIGLTSPDADGHERHIFSMRVARLDAMLKSELANWLRPWGLDVAEFGVLRTLRAAGEPYTLRPTDLKVRLMLTSGGMTSVLHRLGKQGLIDREADGDDGRSSWVRLTPQGLDLAERAIVGWTGALSDIYRKVPEETIRVASDALREILLGLGDEAPAERLRVIDEEGRSSPQP
jgi:DNA-binding MarR family transcriptional regulator